MSFERPTKALLVFQCDVCYDTVELSKDEHNLQDGAACLAVIREEGWTMVGKEHLCADCTKTARADRDNPFRR